MANHPQPAAVKPLKILFLGTQVAVGGAQSLLLDQAEWFARQGYPVTAAFLYDKQALIQGWRRRYDFPILEMGAWKIGSNPVVNGIRLMSGIVRLFRLMRAERFDVVETFTHHCNLVGMPVAWLARVPVRVASHHGRIYGFPRWLEKLHSWMINSGIATWLVVVTDSMQALAVQEGVRPERIRVIANGIALPEIDEQARGKARALLGVETDEVVVMAVGRLAPEKGHTHLIDAASAVLAQYPRTRFVLVGDGVRRAALEEQVRSLQLGERVCFFGMRGDVAGLLAGADIFALPSLSEGFPLALMEAMAAGLAVAASDTGGVKQAVQDGFTGRLVPAGDSQALGQVLIELVGNPLERLRLGQAARQKMAGDYSLDQMVKGYQCLFLDTKLKESK